MEVTEVPEECIGLCGHHFNSNADALKYTYKTQKIQIGGDLKLSLLYLPGQAVVQDLH